MSMPKGFQKSNPYVGTTLPKLTSSQPKRSELKTIGVSHGRLKMREAGFSDFPQGYIGQPFWFSNIGGNHFPREGFTYTPWDAPVVPLQQQMQGYIDDEDAQMGVNFLAAKTTGGRHYFKGKTENLISYISDFTKGIDLDYIAWQTAKELIAFGNSFWKLRKPIYAVKSVDDFQQLPIESLVRVWWTPDRIPQWYEFRGAKYNGYFRPDEIMHFKWNPLNGQVLGFGVMSQLTNRVFYYEDSPDGPILKARESYLDIKHAMQNVAYKSMKRYLPRNIYPAHMADESERAQMRSELRILHDSEDIVHGIKDMTVQELGNATRAYDPSAFMDLFQGSIFKALNTSKGRIAGQSQGPTYANGEQSAILDDIGMSQFPIQLKIALTNLIIRPWYEAQPAYDPELTGNVEIYIPWEMCDFELMFGKGDKTDLSAADMKAWVDTLAAKGAISIKEMRKIAADQGVGLISDEENNLVLNSNQPGDPNDSENQMPQQAPQKKKKEPTKPIQMKPSKE